MPACELPKHTVDEALEEFNTFKGARARYETLRFRQGKDGLDPIAQGDASGGTNFFPKPGQPRPYFTIDGIPKVPDQFTPPAPPPTATPAPAVPAGPRHLDRLEDVLNARPDRFSLDPGAASRPDMREALSKFAARMRAERPQTAVKPPASPAPIIVPQAPVGAAPRPSAGDLTGLNRTADRIPTLGSAKPLPFVTEAPKLDTGPLLNSLREAEEGAKRLQTTLRQDLSDPARQSMETFNTALSAGTAAALATVVAAAAQMRASLSFNASPTITPRYVPPASAPAGGASSPAPRLHSDEPRPV